MKGRDKKNAVGKKASEGTEKSRGEISTRYKKYKRQEINKERETCVKRKTDWSGERKRERKKESGGRTAPLLIGVDLSFPPAQHLPPVSLCYCHQPTQHDTGGD